MNFKKEDIKTEEFKNFIRKGFKLAIKEGFESYKEKYNPDIPSYPFAIMSAMVFVGFYKEKTKEGYGAKAFPYYKIVTYHSEKLDIECSVKNIIEYIKENLDSNEFKDEFEVCGDYENKEDINIKEYLDKINRISFEFHNELSNIDM